MNPTLHRALRTFAKKRSNAPSTGLPVRQRATGRTRGTITSVTTKARTAVVKLARGPVTASYYATRTAPRAGQVVEVEITGNRILILGKP